MEKKGVYWFSNLDDVEKMARDRGYDIEEGAPVMRVELSDVFSSTKVSWLMQRPIPNVECLLFGELWHHHIGDILELLRKWGIDRDESWIREFDGDLSQAVYDEEDNLLAAVMCTEDEEGIFVHLIVSMTNDSEMLVAALQGFLTAIRDWGNGEGTITMVVLNEEINKLMKQMLKKTTHREEIGRVHFVKDASEVDEDFLALLEAEGEKSVIQKNIQWKMLMRMA